MSLLNDDEMARLDHLLDIGPSGFYNNVLQQYNKKNFEAFKHRLLVYVFFTLPSVDNGAFDIEQLLGDLKLLKMEITNKKYLKVIDEVEKKIQENRNEGIS